MPSKTAPYRYRLFVISPLLMVGLACCTFPTAQGQGTRIIEFPAGFGEHAYYQDLAFSSDGRTLVLVNAPDGVVKVRDLTTGKTGTLPRTYNGKSWVDKVAYSKNGQLLAVAYGARDVIVWDMPARRERRRIPLERAGVDDMVFIDGDQTLCALARTKGNLQAVRWDLSSGVRRAIVDFGKDPIPLVLSPNGQYTVLRSKFDEWGVFDLSTRVKAFDLKGGGGWVFTQTGTTLVSCEGNRLSLREVPSGKVWRHFDITPALGLGFDPLPSVSSNGKLLAVQAYPTDNFASLISLETGKFLDKVECGPFLAICHYARLSPDGRVLVTQTGGVNAKDKSVEPILKVWRLPASW